MDVKIVGEQVTSIDECDNKGSSSSSSPTHNQHAASELGSGNENNEVTTHDHGVTAVDEVEEQHQGRFAYFRTKNFYIVLVLGYASVDSHVDCIISAED